MYDIGIERRLEPPEAAAWPACPCCGRETDTFYRDHYGDVIGCPECVDIVDAWEDAI